MHDGPSLDYLGRGIRALAMLARHAPLSRDEFARLNGLSIREACRMLRVYEAGGFVMRTAHGGVYLLTALASDLFGAGNTVAALVARASTTVDGLGRRLQRPVTLSIRRGPWMLCCLASAGALRRGWRPGQQQTLVGSPTGLVQIACGEAGALDVAAANVRQHRYVVERQRDGCGVIAVPIMTDGRVLAVLSVHFDAGCVDPVARYRRDLRRAARRLAIRSAEVATGALPSSANEVLRALPAGLH